MLMLLRKLNQSKNVISHRTKHSVEALRETYALVIIEYQKTISSDSVTRRLLLMRKGYVYVASGHDITMKELTKQYTNRNYVINLPHEAWFWYQY